MHSPTYAVTPALVAPRPVVPTDLWRLTLERYEQVARQFLMGDLAQALPVAFALRAMFHDTLEAKGLLKRLGAWRSVQLISRAEPEPAMLPARLWWRGAVLDVAGSCYTRRMVVLETANTCTVRGGTMAGSPRFERTSKGFYWIQTSRGETAILRGYHFDGLRRVAREMLESLPAVVRASEKAAR